MRKVLAVQSGPAPHWVGDGFPVRSLISPALGEHLSPFLLLDYAAPRQFSPTDQPRGVGVHPHRGFETVTIVYSGEVAHKDSTGQGGVMGAGDVQWMTAASGILHQEFHSETFSREGGTFEVAQLWVNLPAKDKTAEPGYQSLLNADIPSVELADGAGAVRVIAGDYAGQRGPAHTFTPINVWDVRLSGRASFDAPDGHSLAVVVLKGAVKVNGANSAGDGEVVIFDRHGGEIVLETDGEAKLLVLGGEPIDEPVVSYGPFVMNTADEIRAAINDYQSGRFGQMAAA